jgi:hypothetical protein
MPDEWWLEHPAHSEQAAEEGDPGLSLDLGDDHWQPYAHVVPGVDATDDTPAHPVEPLAPEQAALSAVDWELLTGRPAPAAADGSPLTTEQMLAELEARSSDPLVHDLVERLRETYGGSG